MGEAMSVTMIYINTHTGHPNMNEMKGFDLERSVKVSLRKSESYLQLRGKE
jgi:hypothetical protein